MRKNLYSYAVSEVLLVVCASWISTASTMFHAALYQPCGIIALDVHSNISKLQTLRYSALHLHLDIASPLV